MLFRESEILSQQHPNLKNFIKKFDDLLSTFDCDSIINNDAISYLLKEDISIVNKIINEYLKLNLINKEEMIKCSHCKTLNLYSDYEEIINKEEIALCSYCSQNLESGYKLTVLKINGSKSLFDKKQKSQPITHIVLLLHGIRTDGVWQEKLASKLDKIAGIKPYPIGYGFLDVFRFWFPFGTRKKAIEIALKKIRTAKAIHPQAEVSVIAHSFGSYSFFKILEENHDLSFKNIILCGSIISDNYPWSAVRTRITGTVINECGSKDIWPILAKAFSWGYGTTGTLGFKTPGIEDRFHNRNHSGYFDSEFMHQFWIPFFEKGLVIKSDWNAERDKSPWWVGVLSIIPLQWIFTTAALLTIYIISMPYLSITIG